MFCTHICSCQFCRPVVEELEKKNKKVKSVRDMEGFHECAEKVIIKDHWVMFVIGSSALHILNNGVFLDGKVE